MLATKLPEKVHGKNNLVVYMTTYSGLTADRGRGFMICCYIMTNLIYKITDKTCRCKEGQMPLQYFFYLRIFFLAIVLKKGKNKNTNIFQMIVRMV
jgi:hypothetical protein